jgi:gluconolactonase
MMKRNSLFPIVILTVACTAPPTPAPKAEAPATGTVQRLDPALGALVPDGAQIEKLAGGFTFIEGPLWRQHGAVWFSDVVDNVVRQWATDGTVTEILRPGGYDGSSLPAGGFIGPNGMTDDQDGSVLVCQHGNRRIARIAKDGTVTTLIDSFEGKKLNSPNDLVFHRDGSLYFTDPPYGLPKQDEDPAKELDFNGVYRLANGRLQLLVRDMTRPNGIAFSPDYKTLYVANSDQNRRIWMAYDVNADGSVANGRVFADASASEAQGLPDGLKVDQLGNVYATGPGGVWIFDPSGKHLGTIQPPEGPANVGWGGDGKSLYMTATTGLYRIQLAVPGMRPLYAQGPRGIELHVDMIVDPAQEQAMLRSFETEFRQAASQQPGFIDVKILKLRSTLMGKAPARVNYRFVISFRSEEDRQKWIAADIHQRVWPVLENTLVTKDYTVTLYDTY